MIRLSCITPATGAVSIVIPPWNGFYGKRLNRSESLRVEEEGATENETIA